MIIAVDFDGVIHNGRYEIDDAIDTLIYAKKKGHKLILWTCKSEKRLKNVIAWCSSKGVQFDAINACVPSSSWFCAPKVFADVYIDDKSFPPFSGWKIFKKFLDG